MATVFQQKKNFPQALQNYDGVLKREPSNQIALFNRASVLETMGRNSESLDAFLAFVKTNPDNFAAQMNLGQLYYNIQNYAAAKYRFGLAQKLDPQSAAAFSGIGRSELEEAAGLVDPNLRKQELADAEKQLKSALAKDPKNVNFIDHLSTLYERTARYEDASALYKPRLASDPGDKRSAIRLSTIYKEQRKVDDAVSLWRAYRVRKPEDVAGYREPAELLALNGKRKEAVAEMNLWLDKNPNDGVSLRFVAQLAQDDGDTKEAKRRLEQMAKADITGKNEPDVKMKPRAKAEGVMLRINGLRGLAALADAENKPEEAINDLREAKAYDEAQATQDNRGPDLTIRHALALAYEKAKQPDKAIEEFQSIANSNTREDAALIEIARIAERLNKTDEAVKALKEAAQRKPESVDARLKAGMLLRRKGLLPSAIQEFTEASKAFPKDIKPLTELAQAYEAAGQDANAVDAFNATLKVDPTATWVEDRKSAALVRLKRYPEARATFDAALKRRPDNVQTMSDIVRIYTLEGKDADALVWLKTRLQATPSSRAVMGFVTGEYARQKQEEAGWQLLKEHAAAHADAATQAAYASVLLQGKRLPEAVAIYRKIADSVDPKDPGAHLSAQIDLVDALDAAGNTDESNAKLQALLNGTYAPDALDNVRRRLAERYALAKRNKEAIALYQEVFSRANYDPVVGSALVDLLQAESRDREAVPILLSLLKFDGLPSPAKANLRNKLGSVYEKIGNKSEALAQYKITLMLSPNNAEALAAQKRLTNS